MATFYAARSEIITPLTWLTFALPVVARQIQTAVSQHAHERKLAARSPLSDGCGS